MLEMLVVMAIILVLAGIMMPVLLRAKAHATGGSCVSNLEQLHRALLIYSSDNGGGSGLDVLPLSLAVITDPRITSCRKGSGPYQAMWQFEGWNEYSKANGNPIMVVDNGRSVHGERAIGLFLNGNVQQRRTEGNALAFTFW